MAASTSPIPKTQRAAVTVALRAPVEIKTDWPVVQPEDLVPGQILVKMEASGICHSDLHIKDGEWPSRPVPFVGGHEGIGIIVALGKGTVESETVRLGSRVGIKYTLGSCGRCEYCRSGLDTACAKGLYSGLTDNGTFCEYMVAYADSAVPIPEGVTSEEAVPVLCAGVTVYNGLKRSGTKAGDWIVVPGAGGGLGLLAVQYAAAKGLRVIAIDTGAEKKEACLSLGAEKWVDFKESSNLVGDVVAAAGDRGPHAAIIVTPSIAAYGQAVQYVRHFGTIVAIGVPSPSATLQVPFSAIVGKSRVLTHIRRSLQDAIDALAFVARRKVIAQTLPRKLEDLNATYDDMIAGKLVGRAVIRF
ncbi:mannitol-1-phosphate dehydrogenase M1PDH1 [Vararia minispora EC-137]|uniref:Mannitol-1-phosphate dehydrogenase M1PDH1 n=1 Tax=Vararia minispora EC-137 TaxID=1314806 RepID=A0ACB8QAD5_9AGAM|nr:mannitol-1-phosphate dehydrogenase M1PDH1 [Vararia minispora EC-137]